MPSLVLCSNGLVATIETEPNLSLLLAEHEGATIGRFSLDVRELSGALRGELSLQSSDEHGNSVSMSGNGNDVVLKLISGREPPVTCRLNAGALREALEKAQIRV